MSDLTPRDELAQIINEYMEADVPETVADKHEPVDADYAMADEIIRAGWRPPARVITTTGELEELPDGSVIVENGGRAYLKIGIGVWEPDGPTWTLALPATVLWEPEEDE